MDIRQVPVTEVPQGATILDVREDNEFAAGHAAGAVHLPLGEVRGRLHDVPEGSPLYVICASGGRSGKVAAFLAEQGRDVANVEGGTKAWAAARLPMEADGDDEPRVVAPDRQPPAEV